MMTAIPRHRTAMMRRVRMEVRCSVVHNTEHSCAILTDSSHNGRFGNSHAFNHLAIPAAKQGDRSANVVGRHVGQPRNRQATTVVVQKVLHERRRAHACHLRQGGRYAR